MLAGWLGEISLRARGGIIRLESLKSSQCLALRPYRLRITRSVVGVSSRRRSVLRSQQRRSLTSSGKKRSVVGVSSRSRSVVGVSSRSSFTERNSELPAPFC